MTDKVVFRMRQIEGRCIAKQKKRDRYAFSALSVACFGLFCSLFTLLYNSMGEGGHYPTVIKGYGTLLLRSGAGIYIVVGIIAFTLGVAFTLLCSMLEKNQLKMQKDFREKMMRERNEK